MALPSSGSDSMKKNVPTPHFGRRPGVDKIDEIIEDTDKALKGLPSRLPPTGPDPKALKDAFLETSPSFQEMLQALEAFDAGAAGGEGQGWRMRWSLIWRESACERGPRRGGPGGGERGRESVRQDHLQHR
jgi:hypothetical protein